MLSLPDLLRRFRRAWAPPGPALARVAPPVDVSAQLRAELETVLAAIAEIQKQAAAIRSNADAKAKQVAEAASRDADEQVRTAEAAVPDVRAKAAAERQHAVETEIQSSMQAAQAEAQRIGAQADARLPALVAKVTAAVLATGDHGR